MLLGLSALAPAPAQAQSVSADIDAPIVSLIDPLVVNSDTTLTVEAEARAGSGSSLQSFRLLVNGTEEVSTEDATIAYDLSLTQPGRTDVEVVAEDTDGTTARDSFSVVYAAPTQEEPVPTGIEDGITYTSSTSATLVLQAPRKEYVHLVGEMTDWEVQPAYQMKRETVTADSVRYWIELQNLEPGKEYGFQYLVDGEIRIPDPYSRKVLTQNDGGISEETYPDLKPYPGDQAEQLVSVLQTDQSSFNFSSFERPEQKDLVIYELLVRDFIENHNYQTMQDTLAYLDRLGVNAIELMPVSEFDGNESWGYNPALYFATDKYYGPARELKQFIEAAHNNGIAVILDVVYNHQTGQSPFIRLFNEGTFGPPTSENPWANPEAKHPFNVFNDNNHESSFTKYWLDRANEYWLTEFNVDGFRFDLSKGFTQGPNNEGYGEDVGAWSSFDQERVDLLKRMADEIWSVDDNAYIILEHFAATEEEQELATYRTGEGLPGMMLWNNMNRPYSQSAMGYISASDFSSDLSSTYYRNRGLDVPNYVTYMESHDEQWLMYRNIAFGNSSDEGYDVTDFDTALERQKLVGAFFFTVPGPRMMWQFGELGYGYGEEGEECLREGGGEGGECPEVAPGRTAPKPIRWEYRDPEQSPGRVDLYKTWSALINLRNENEVFTSTDTQVDLRVGQGEPGRRIGLQHASMNAIVVGNFDVDTLAVAANFPSTGTWYDFFTGEAVSIESDEQDTPIPMAPGEFHIYTDEPVSTPEAGIVPYDVAAPPPPAPTDLSAEVNRDAGTVALSWSASNASDLTGYTIYRGATAGFDTTGARIGQVGPETTTFTDDGLSLGDFVRYRVVATDSDGMTSGFSNSVPAVVYPQSIQASVSRSFDDGADAEDYRLVALPGDASQNLGETLSGEAGTTWQAYWDDGSSSDFFQAFDGSSTFDFAPGRGFWLISESSWQVDAQIPTVPLTQEDGRPGVDIPLHSGWNIISNPLGVEVDWRAVQSANGGLQPLWRFDGSFFQTTRFTAATSGEAYYFNNQTGRTRLFIPYPSGSNASSAAKESVAATDDARTVRLTAEVGDGAASTVEVGVADDAQNGVGTEDVIAPPSRFEAVSLRVRADDSDASTRQRSLVRSLRSAGGDGQVYDLRLQAEKGVTTTLSAQAAEDGPSLRLINRETGERFDLREDPTVTITTRSADHPLALVVGSAAFVKKETERLRPEELQLWGNYPNPFRQQTTIEYSLPESGQVTLEVYDILGRRVAVPVDRRQRAGMHRVPWNAADASSGIYLVRLTVDGETRTGKMTVVQ